jgi:hypothetical protein
MMSTLVEVSLKGSPYIYRPHMTRKPNNSFKWLIPLVAAGQYMIWKEILKPELDSDYKKLRASDEHIWNVKTEDRRRLGIGPPLRPSKENAWRLEQIYEDD